jgi:DNA-binding response OmpR family regulator
MKKKILIVEDDKHFSGYLTDLLSEYDIQTAVDGIYGLKIGKIQKPDIVIIDLGLPRMSGEEMMERLREDEVLKEVPVVLVSGSFLKKYEGEVVRDYPANAVFTKPFDPAVFKEKISSLISSR